MGIGCMPSASETMSVCAGLVEAPAAGDVVVVPEESSDEAAGTPATEVTCLPLRAIVFVSASW